MLKAIRFKDLKDREDFFSVLRLMDNWSCTIISNMDGVFALEHPPKLERIYEVFKSLGCFEEVTNNEH